MINFKLIDEALSFLQSSSAEFRAREQDQAVSLLFGNPGDSTDHNKLESDSHYRRLRQLLGATTPIFALTPLSETIYRHDSGTAFIPAWLLRLMIQVKARFVIRPLNLSQLATVVSYAAEHKLSYTIRGTGTWPFGGAVPLRQDLVIELSYLDFHRLYPESATLAVGPGAIFAVLRPLLQERGFALQTEITNPNSGTICGWIATGGLGLGAYKYGHVADSVMALLLLTPDGQWQRLTREDELFPQMFGSEGQLGIIAGAVLAVRPLTYVSKAYAFSFPDVGQVQQFLHLLEQCQLRPAGVIYYDREYLETTREIFAAKSRQALDAALDDQDEFRIRRSRHELDVAQKFANLQEVLVMEFDNLQDYQRTLKYPPFVSDKRRYRSIRYRRLDSDLAHHLWNHRFLPVEMKQHGPAMLVSEILIPVTKLAAYVEFIRSIVTRWTNNPVKFEGHLLADQRVLLQNVILADPDVRRHTFYFSLVPLMTQAALQFHGSVYGCGIWNLPFMTAHHLYGNAGRLTQLQQSKKRLDPHALINRGKFINRHSRKLSLSLFQRFAGPFLGWIVRLLQKGWSRQRRFSLYALATLLWRISKRTMPLLVPPGAKAKRSEISAIITCCAECDSCERVCPTSDMFGSYGPATAITRRKTARRLDCGAEISRQEALGFLVCTRCDNCTRVCPTAIPLTRLFDIVEAQPRFQQALQLSPRQKQDFIERFWQISKESPLYRPHTRSDHQEQRSHLEHGLKIHYARGFAYARLFIDPETCIRCGMCAHEHACTYDAREGQPRSIPELIDHNCALCNACINFCPQNKAIQKQRDYRQEMVHHAVDQEEKKYWQQQYALLRDTTTIERSSHLLAMADIYVSEEILMEIDKEAATGNIPVSGMGQGDRHMGIGFDSERFSHFHIVGPAQNRLHEGDPDEELSVALGRRHRYCRFSRDGQMHNPPYPVIKLRTPLLYNHLPLDSNGRVELALIKVAERQNSLVVIRLSRLLEYYDFFRDAGGYRQLPPVLLPRLDHEVIQRLLVSPHTQRELLMDLWRMPAFEIVYHQNLKQTVSYIQASAQAISHTRPLLCGYLPLTQDEIVGGKLNFGVEQKIENFLACGIEIIHIHGRRNQEQYYVTSRAVRAVHHYLLESGRRHTVALIASGGIRLASDSQKTIQRGAEATLLDIAALLALDPSAYRAVLDRQSTTPQLIDLDIDWAVQRLNNQMEARKIQILEVLGASGFKDIKKTVGEEGRLIDFYHLEERLQHQLFLRPLNGYIRSQRRRLTQEPISSPASSYSRLKQRVLSLENPHYFYHLSETNQQVYQRDHVWPGWIIETIGRMASGDPRMFHLKNVKGTGLLGDGFDVMKILYKRDPDSIPESELEAINTALVLDKGLVLDGPWMFGGKSVGSIGLDSWKAHVIAAQQLGIQYDTGEGGYPTAFFLDGNGEPIFFRESDIEIIQPYFSDNTRYNIREIKAILASNQITAASHPQIYQAMAEYADLEPFRFYVVIAQPHELFVSTELKTGLFGVTKQTIKKTRRVVIAYSQGAKMGIGGHILAQKVNKLVSYLRGVEGIGRLDGARLQQFIDQIEKIQASAAHPLQAIAAALYPHLLQAQDEETVFPELHRQLIVLRQHAYELRTRNEIDPIQCEKIIALSKAIIYYAYSSIISPFPFHNCYSIEDVKAFIDIVRMINPGAAIAVKVSPSVDIEFIATGLARIARDNTAEALRLAGVEPDSATAGQVAAQHGMVVEIWLDGPRGGTGASPNIIKGQMGMHIEYAIPLIHHRLVEDGLRDYVKFFVSGGIRTYEDVIKAIALGADGVIWGTAPLVAIGCDRNRNCHDGCSRGIATSNLVMQKLRNVERDAAQMVNVFTIMQMQVIRALAGLGFNDIRELRGRHDKIQWIGLKERVDFRCRQRQSLYDDDHATAQSNCGVAALIATEPIPSYILDQALAAMKNRGMDGVGVAKSLCFPEFPDAYAFRIMVKGIQQREREIQIQAESSNGDAQPQRARQEVLAYRRQLATLVRQVFLDPVVDYAHNSDSAGEREPYKQDHQGHEYDYRRFGGESTDPGDIFRWFVRIKLASLEQFIEQRLLRQSRYLYIREYYPEVTAANYHQHPDFLRKAEDLMVFDLATMLTLTLYVRQPNPQAWREHLQRQGVSGPDLEIFASEQPLAPENIASHGQSYLELLQSFAAAPKDHHQPRRQKFAAVMSCGKNFGVWKTAGREIPWQTPAAANNIIHVRLATGSVVEQMNAHPFAKLHTALTHNGETTNYETLKQRVEQFGLQPLATTDTEVAALKFHLVADELEYPDWALFESFSPTTGEDLALVAPELRSQLEEIQRVEFTSSPDGPYQYLCLRHRPEARTTERVDLKDPADLRPSTTALWLDHRNGRQRAFSMIASEEQAVVEIMRLLDAEGLTDGAVPDWTMVSDGMISRCHFDDQGITAMEFYDRYGRALALANPGHHYSIRRTPPTAPANATDLGQELAAGADDLPGYIRSRLADWDFNTFAWVMTELARPQTSAQAQTALAALTCCLDHWRHLPGGNKARSSLRDISQTALIELLTRLPQLAPDYWQSADMALTATPATPTQTVVVNAHSFEPQGTDPRHSLSALLAQLHQCGWRRFILYQVRGQRLISTAVMGDGDTDDVEIDIYGTPGEYLGAFMQGGVLRVHGNAQNFTAMGMHHGTLQIFGNAGKVCGYASKGGRVFVLGDINDRAWANSVNDSRCQSLQVHIFGSASKYAGESLMGGDFFCGGLSFATNGSLRTQPRPYRGTKLLGGASRGAFLFFDPNHALLPEQYTHGRLVSLTAANWPYWRQMVLDTLLLAGVSVDSAGEELTFEVDGRQCAIVPENFKCIQARGSQKGYESH